MKNFPKMVVNSLDDVMVLCRFLLKERGNDVYDFNSLQDTFMRGRKVGKVPSSSLDVADTDREGDFNYDDTYIYFAVISGSNVEWRRVELLTW